MTGTCLGAAEKCPLERSDLLPNLPAPRPARFSLMNPALIICVATVLTEVTHELLRNKLLCPSKTWACCSPFPGSTPLNILIALAALSPHHDTGLMFFCSHFPPMLLTPCNHPTSVSIPPRLWKWPIFLINTFPKNDFIHCLDFGHGLYGNDSTNKSLSSVLTSAQLKACVFICLSHISASLLTG